MQVTYLSFVVDAVVFVVGLLLLVKLTDLADRRERKMQCLYGVRKVVEEFAAFVLVLAMFLAYFHAGTALVLLIFPMINHPPIYL
ncbi:MAG: hypothetical protein HYW90_02935 [Candidatus Sungbacteria bacterium]|nr:hypothetical protein [Candidatus Sungbacteria bacterium]